MTPTVSVAYVKFMENDPTRKAIAKAGGPAALAKKLGITAQAVSQWKHIPARHVVAISDLTDIPVRSLLPRPAKEVAHV